MEESARQIISGATTAFTDLAYQSNPVYRPAFISNNRKNNIKVLTSIENELKSCDSFVFSVAFITQSGIEPFLMIFSELEKRGVKGRILTTDYNTFTEPKALDKLAQLKNIELRMYRVGGKEDAGFHTKGYIFGKDGAWTFIMGSANMTGRALSVNKEWNTRFVSTEIGEFFRDVFSEFEMLWSDRQHTVSYGEFIEDYRTRYEIIKTQRQTALADAKERDGERGTAVSLEKYRLEPNPMQVAFTANLKRIAENGESKALLISATGTGKTFASAFGIRDALKPEGKVLFVVHRKQILRQAMESYRRVFGKEKKMAILSGEDRDFEKIKSADFVFAMITMISRDDVMKRFRPDEFEICTIDEVHHASAPSYRRIMDHFTPSFWLGMTATPDRTDDGNIYEIFDHNIAYEIRLQQAMENDLLCAFHYFGIHDIVFDEKENADELIKLAEKGDLSVFKRLTADQRVDHIIRQASYYGYSGYRVKGLMFCSSVAEAQALSQKLNARGLRTIALSGADTDEQRQEAVDRLTQDEAEDCLDYILTVNIFNEGVDIPDINQVVMLRPTESPIVFIQQLGRGLRKHDGKEFVVVLDFIGNYTNNFMIPIALSGDRTYNKDNLRKYIFEGSSVIAGCSSVHFDEVSQKAIFSAIDKASTPLKMLKEKYMNLRDRLGRMPTACEFYQYGEVDPILFMEYCRGSYYTFVKKVSPDDLPASFDEKQERTLDYVSTQIANGKRLHELIMLKQLTQEGSTDRESFAKRLKNAGLEMKEGDFESAKRVLDKSFLNTQGDRNRYIDVEVFENGEEADSRRFARCASYLKMTGTSGERDRAFLKALQDLIRYGFLRYSDMYSEGDADSLVLYQKYSRRDVCRLLNWERDDSSTIYGYRIKYNTCPIFVTYEKKDDISETTKYEDQFIDPERFSWMTRSRVSMDSTESQEIINADRNGMRIFLFIKKSDDEGTDFYYMGRVHPGEYRETTINDKNGNPLPIMNFCMKLENAVRADIYDYLIK